MADIEFESYSLQSANIITNSIDGLEQHPSRDFVTKKIPNDHGRVIESDFFNSRKITLTGIIIDSSSANLDSRIDTIKEELSVQSGNLDIVRGGSTRRFLATLIETESSIDRSRHYDIVQAKFRFVFECLTPFGENTSYTTDDDSFTAAGPSTSAKSFTINNTGTAPTPLGFAITMSTSAANITSIKVENFTTGYYMTIDEPTANFANGNVLNFDQIEKKLTLTQSGVTSNYYYIGKYIELLPGSQSVRLYISYTSTAPTGNFEVTFVPKWL